MRHNERHACRPRLRRFFLESRQQGRRRFRVGIAGVARGLLSQFVELALDGCGLVGVAGGKRLARPDPAAQQRNTRYRAPQQRMRGPGQRRTVFHQRKQRLLQRARRRRHEREAAGAMDAAQRMPCPHHRRRRHGQRIELQRGQLVLEHCDVLHGLVAQDHPQHARQRDLADRDVIGRHFSRRRLGGSGCRGAIGHRCRGGRHFADQAQRGNVVVRHFGRQRHVDGLENFRLERNDAGALVAAESKLGQIDECERGLHRGSGCRWRRGRVWHPTRGGTHQVDDVGGREFDHYHGARKFALDGGHGGFQRARIGVDAAFVGQCVHPVAKIRLGDANLAPETMVNGVKTYQPALGRRNPRINQR